jgi:diacylglycerol kinase family enzyme
MGAAGRLEEISPRIPAAPRLRKVEFVVNPRAGSAGPDPAEVLGQTASAFGLAHRIRTPEPDALWNELREAVDSGPDLLVTVAGDGTARAAASLCGPDGPLVAPLAGGTMNILPHALYGPADWKTALQEVLQNGVETEVSGGEVDERRFFVAAILGAPALWAEAREAARMRKLQLAWRKTANAWRRAFSHRLRFSLDSGLSDRTLALVLMCPLASRTMDGNESALEAAALDPRGVAEALRIGARAVMSRLVGDWRNDPAVEVSRCQAGRAWTEGSHLRAILDGEPMRLHKQAEIRFVPVAFRALAPPKSPAAEAEPPP